MIVQCVWEHNGNDTLLYAVNLPGAYARGASKETAMEKMVAEACGYLRWKGQFVPADIAVEIIQDASCGLQICDADSDVLFASEHTPLTMAEYLELKALALKSAEVALLAEGIEIGRDADVRVALRDEPTGIFSVKSRMR